MFEYIYQKKNNYDKKIIMIDYKKEYKKLQGIELKNIDILCPFHLKKINSTYNMCKYCKYLYKIKFPESYDKTTKYIYIKNEPEKILNIDFTKIELDEFKSQINLIEKKINEIKPKVDKNYYYNKLYEFCIIKSILYTYETLKKENKLNYTAIKNLRTIKLNPDFNIKNDKIYYKIKMTKVLGEDLKILKKMKKINLIIMKKIY